MAMRLTTGFFSQMIAFFVGNLVAFCVVMGTALDFARGADLNEVIINRIETQHNAELRNGQFRKAKEAQTSASIMQRGPADARSVATATTSSAAAAALSGNSSSGSATTTSGGSSSGASATVASAPAVSVASQPAVAATNGASASTSGSSSTAAHAATPAAGASLAITQTIVTQQIVAVAKPKVTPKKTPATTTKK